MTTATVEAVPQRPPGERGALLIADRVLERIAVAAAGEVEGVLPAPAKGLQRVLHPSRRIGADADQDDASARQGGVALTLTLAVRYPLPIARTTAAVRDHVKARLRDLAGRDVTEMTIQVTHLTHPDHESSRRVQ
jgi:uncharacterized alkaline shock family protein YloU